MRRRRRWRRCLGFTAAATPPRARMRGSARRAFCPTDFEGEAVTSRRRSSGGCGHIGADPMGGGRGLWMWQIVAASVPSRSRRRRHLYVIRNARSTTFRHQHFPKHDPRLPPWPAICRGGLSPSRSASRRCDSRAGNVATCLIVDVALRFAIERRGRLSRWLFVLATNRVLCRCPKSSATFVPRGPGLPRSRRPRRCVFVGIAQLA